MSEIEHVEDFSSLSGEELMDYWTRLGEDQAEIKEKIKKVSAEWHKREEKRRTEELEAREVEKTDEDRELDQVAGSVEEN